MSNGKHERLFTSLVPTATLEMADKAGDVSTFNKEFLLNRSSWAAINVDNVWEHLGHFGRYQRIQSILATVFALSVAPTIIGSIFNGGNVNFRCADDNSTFIDGTNSTVINSCRKVVKNQSADETCNTFVYGEHDRHRSYISEWDLVCDREALGNLPQILTMVGMGVGAFIIPPLGDRFGRKKVLVVSELVLTVTLGLMAFTPYFELFAALKFLSGVADQGQTTALATLHLELYPTKQRSAIGFLVSLYWTFSYSFLIIVSWCLQGHNWRILQLAYACSAAVCVFLRICFQEESVRWLLGNGHIEKAQTILKKACKMNKKNYTDLVNSVIEVSPCTTEPNGGKDGVNESSRADKNAGMYGNDNSDDEILREERPKVPYIALLRTPGVRKITLIMAYTWFITSLTYYGLLLMSSSFYGDLYVNNIFLVALELCAAIVMFYTIFRFGRKRTTIAFVLLAGLALFSAVLVVHLAPPTTTYFVLQTVLLQMGKGFISGSFATIWCYTPEVYATNIRTMGLGVSSSSARIGSALSPLFGLLARRVAWAPGAIFSVSCLICVFLLMMMPETRWRELPNSIDDVEAWFKGDNETTGRKTRSRKQTPKDEAGQELTKIIKNARYTNELDVEPNCGGQHQ